MLQTVSKSQGELSRHGVLEIPLSPCMGGLVFTEKGTAVARQWEKLSLWQPTELDCALFQPLSASYTYRRNEFKLPTLFKQRHPLDQLNNGELMSMWLQQYNDYSKHLW